MRAYVLSVLMVLNVGLAMGAGGVSWPGQEPRDWTSLDWQLNRSQMIGRYMNRVPAGGDPTQDMKPDPFLLDEFPPLTLSEYLELPAKDQAERRQLAEVKGEESRQMLLVFGRLRDAGKSQEAKSAQPNSQQEDEARLIPKAIGYLRTATYLNPADPVAWYDLAYFTGLLGWDEFQEESLLNFLQASETSPSNLQLAMMPQRIRANLDLAWMYRERGEMDQGLASTLEASRLMKDDETANGLESREARLIAGLIHAEMGDTSQAAVLAAPLVDMKVHRRNYLAHTWPQPFFNKGRHAMNMPRGGFGSQAQNLPSGYVPSVPTEKTSWEKVKYPWARNWVLAKAALRQGDGAKALQTMGRLDPLEEYPVHMNHRLWNDRGLMYEAVGNHPAARRCYALAALHRPYFIYYPLQGLRGVARAYDTTSSGYSYFLGADKHYTCGSLFSYASNCLLIFELEKGEERRLEYGRLAEKWLTACVHRHIKPARSRALRGRFYFLEGNYQLAEADLLKANEMFLEQGIEEPEITLTLGLLAFNSKDYPGAAPWLDTFNRLKPEAGVGWRAQGLTRTFNGDLPGAEAAFNNAVKFEPEHPGGWFNRALVRIKRGDRQGAIADLDQAHNLLPLNEDIIRILKAIESGPLPDLSVNASPIQLSASAQSARMLGRMQKEEQLNLAAEVSGDDERLQWSLDPKLADKRLPELEKAFRYEPSHKNRTQLAWCLLSAQKPAQAQRLLEPLWGRNILTEDLAILLEADRIVGESSRAIAMAHELPEAYDLHPDPEVWSRVAAICMAEGREELGQKAMTAVRSAMEVAGP